MTDPREFDVCVVGDSLATLTAALEFAEVGLRVHVVLPPGEPGDWPDAPELDPDDVLTALLDRVAAPIAAGRPGDAAVRPVRTAPRGVLMVNTRSEWSPVPVPQVLGIPAVPVSSAALAFLPTGAAIRAYLDRVKPLLTVGKTHELGRLVRTRLGAAVLERLVEPHVRERYGRPDVEVAIAAPGLNEALTRAGSLSGAVLAYSERSAARETGVAPAGGWKLLREALIERLGHYGVELRSADVDVRADAEDGWRIIDGGEQIAVRAVIADPGTPLPESLAEALAPLHPERRRCIAAVRIADPGIDVESNDALQQVVLRSGDTWSVRIVFAGSSHWLARLVGPVTTGRGAEAHADALEALAAAGFEPQGEWVSAVRAAPYGTVAEREADRTLLAAERSADPTLLPIGRSLYGDDLAAALADTITESVSLRRRLVGIADASQ